jgi:hypothetical protein
MSQQPVTGRGAGEEPGRGAGRPGGAAGERRDRDSRLAGFAQGGAGDACPPDSALAVTLEELSGPDWRCDGATDNELVGLLGRWQAVESWAAAGKLGVVRELIRRRALPGQGKHRHGDLPDAWEEGLDHEVSAELGIALPTADKLIVLGWDLRARLPGIGAKLACGQIDALKARIISDELSVLDDEHAARAEAMILDRLAGKTPGQVGKLAAQAVCAVDPLGAQKRREYAERDEARVRFWRENGGACALAAYGLPTDEALAANANVNRRAEEYKNAKVRPDARIDQLRVLAFLDLINGVSTAARIARARAGAGAAQGNGTPESSTPSGNDAGNDVTSPGDGPGSAAGGGSEGDGGGGPHRGRPGDPAGGPIPALPARANLTIPLITLVGMAELPGVGHGLGPLDPALARDLAATAAASPQSQWCMTVTDASGVAIGHGCAGPARNRAKAPSPGSRDGPWAFTRRDDPGPPGGHGTWTLTFPDGRELTVRLGPVPVTDCDHRHESHAYQPSDTLRHLVEIRDGECSFPPCSRQARGCDFEHAVPYDKGGRTCACNGSARSRRCHRVKQSRGWTVTQPRPGWHHWTTPSGRTYTQGPMRYPV